MAYYGRELWRTDGRVGGESAIKDIRPGPLGSFLPEVAANFVIFDDYLWFMANDDIHGYEVWRSGGTAENTTIVKDIFPGPGGSMPQHFTVVNDSGIMIFTADSGSGTALWRTDGTQAGTRQIAEISSGGGSSMPADLTIVNNTLFFSAMSDSVGRELWRIPLSTLAPQSQKLYLPVVHN